MLKKIVFCLQTMTLGGVEKELITVLKQIHNWFDITVLLLHLDDIDILAEIPNDVKIINVGIEKDYYYGNTLSLVKQRIKKAKFVEAAIISLKWCLRIGTTGSNISISSIPAIEDMFDIAICYHIHSPLMFKYVADKVNAIKKIAWIHNDFYVTRYPIKRLKKYVVAYDEFVAVSKKVEREFRELCSWYYGGISTAYNYLDSEEIIELSKKEIDNSDFLHEKKVKVLTIGRFTEQKGVDIAIKVAALLKNEDIKFHWFLIGHGELETEYRQLINEYNVSDCFSILGKKKNPYPYIKKCDICVQPSRHEAYPLVIMEAKILRKPIVCTDFDGADEQIANGLNGIIVPLNDTVALFKELKKLIRSPEARASLSRELEIWRAEDSLKKIVKHFE